MANKNPTVAAKDLDPQVLTIDPGLRQLADVAFRQIDALLSAADKADIEALDVKFEAHMSAFVTTAAQLLS